MKKNFQKIILFILLVVFLINVLKIQYTSFLNLSEDLLEEVLNFSEGNQNDDLEKIENITDNFFTKATSNLAYINNFKFEITSKNQTNKYKEPLLDDPFSPPEI